MAENYANLTKNLDLQFQEAKLTYSHTHTHTHTQPRHTKTHHEQTLKIKDEEKTFENSESEITPYL